MNEDITIISVFARDADLLKGNMSATRKFNPNSAHRWILVNASSENTARFDTAGEQVEWYEGVREESITGTLLKPVSQSQGMSVNWGIRNSKTRFVCILDPDFFVCYPNWLSALTQYMDAADVGIIGAPYSPQWYDKAHTLCGHFMIIDTKRIPRVLIAFHPNLRDMTNIGLRKGWGWWLLRRIPFLSRRAATAHRYDCGSQIEERFGDQIEYLTAVIDVHKDRLYNTLLDRLIDLLLPAQWRFIRSKVPYIEVRRVAKEAPIRSELYYWNGYPFSLHFRKHGYGVSTGIHEVIGKIVSDQLSAFYVAHRGLL